MSEESKKAESDVDPEMLKDLSMMMELDLVKNEGAWKALEHIDVFDNKQFDEQAKSRE